MRGNAHRRILATAAPYLVLGAFMLGNAVDAGAMGWFGGGSHNSGPRQTVFTTNKNNSNNQSNGTLSITANPVVVNPEPSTIVLLASGLLGLGLWKFRRKP